MEQEGSILTLVLLLSVRNPGIKFILSGAVIMETAIWRHLLKQFLWSIFPSSSLALPYFIRLENWLDFLAQMCMHNLGFTKKKTTEEAQNVTFTLCVLKYVLEDSCFYMSWNSSQLSVPLSEEACCWRLTCAKLPSYQLQGKHSRLMLGCRMWLWHNFICKTLLDLSFEDIWLWKYYLHAKIQVRGCSPRGVKNTL